MFKHSSKSLKKWILCLFNGCLKLGITPCNWKFAFLYPIPKPMEWESDINKTRPIVLLKVIRKLFVKIITTRLSIVLLIHKILKGGNHAGLPEGSMFEPIRCLQLVMED